MINIDQSNNCIIGTIWRNWKNYYPWRFHIRENRFSNAYLSNLDLNLKSIGVVVSRVRTSGNSFCF